MGEQRVVLRHVSDVPLPRRHMEAARRLGVGDAVERHVAAVEPVEAGEQAQDRRLAGAALPHHDRRAARGGLEGDVQRERVPPLSEARVEHGRRAPRGARG